MFQKITQIVLGCSRNFQETQIVPGNLIQEMFKEITQNVQRNHSKGSRTLKRSKSTQKVPRIQGTTQIDPMNHSNWSKKTLKIFQRFTQVATGNHSKKFQEINQMHLLILIDNFGDLISKTYFVRIDAIIGGGLFWDLFAAVSGTGAYYRSWKTPKDLGDR